MKKLTLFFALFAMLALGVGNAWAEEVTANFGWSNWDGVTASFSGNAKDEVTQTVDGVVVTYTRNGASLYANNTALRFYKSNTLKFDAPSNFSITSISFACTSYKDDITSNTGTCTATSSKLSWSGDASSVTFTRPSGASSYATITSATITLSSAGGETPEPNPDPTPNPEPEPGTGGGETWTLVTNGSDLKAGDIIVIASNTKGFVASNTITSDYMGQVSTTFSADKTTITTLPAEAAQLTIGGTSGAWTLTYNEKQLGATAVKKVAWDSGTKTWSITIAKDGGATIQNGTSTYGRFLHNVSSTRFTTYTSNATSSMLLPQIYKKVTSSGGETPEPTCTPINPTLTYSSTSLLTNSTATATLEGNTGNGDVTYTTSDDKVATVAVDGTVTAVGAGTATITATIAAAGEYCEGTATAKITVTPLISCSEVYGLDDNATFALKEFVVTYANGKYTYIKDDTGYGVIFTNSEAYGLEAGNVVASGKLFASKTTYRGLVEIIPTTPANELGATSNTAPDPEVMNAAPVEGDMNKYAKFESVTFASEAFSSNSIKGTFRDNEITFYNTFGASATFDTSKKYNVVGCVSIYNTLQVNFISAEEVAEPTLNVKITDADFGKVAINDSHERTLTLNGSLLTKPVELTIEGNYFTLASNSITPTDGSISEAKIKITYKPTVEGTHTATLKITSDELAEQTITLQGQAVQQHTVKFFVNGDEQTDLAKKVLSGNTLEELPTATSCDQINYPTFAGWASAAIDGTTDVKPAMLDLSTPITSDCNYYAVFAKGTISTGTANTSYELVLLPSHFTTSYNERSFTATANEVDGEGTFEVSLTSAGVMKSTDASKGNPIQFRKESSSTSPGAIYNTTDLEQINSISYADGTNNIASTIIGASQQSTEQEDGKGFFMITNGTSVSYIPSITINFTKTSVSEITTYEYITSCAVVVPTCEIKYDYDGGEGECTTEIVKEGAEYTLCSTAPTKAGHTFLNWKDQNGGEYAVGATITSVTEDLTLTAQWQVNSYKVTWMSLGSKLSSSDVNYNTQPTQPTTNPTYLCGTDKEFVGWTTQEIEGVGVPANLYADEFPVVTYAITYHAVFASINSSAESTTHTLTPNNSWSGYKEGTITDDKGYTWSYNAAGQSTDDVYSLNLRNKDTETSYIGSPLFTANVKNIKATIVNGSASKARKVYVCSAPTLEPTTGDLGITEVAGGHSGELSLAFEGTISQFYLQVSDALQFQSIKVEVGEAPYIDYVTSCEEVGSDMSNSTKVTPSVESGIFSVGEGKYVQFSTGNLQYEVGTNTWSFASEQYEVIGGEAYDPANPTNTNYGMNEPGYTGKLDLFGWSSDGKFGVNPSNADDDYTGEFADWGKLVSEEGWYTLTASEMHYLLGRKKDKKNLWTTAELAGKVVLILLPDNWDTTTDLEYGYVPATGIFGKNVLTIDDWKALEEKGAVLLPSGGSRTGGYGNKIGFDGETEETDDTRLDANGYYFHVNNVGDYGYYWLNTTTSSEDCVDCAAYLITPGFIENDPTKTEDDQYTSPQVPSREKRRGNSVRLVKEFPAYTITATAENGTVTGAGTYPQGAEVTLTADPAMDHTFVSWTKGGEVVSTANPFVFTASENLDLVANFQLITPTETLLSGKFSTGKYEVAQFATGNLQYNVKDEKWSFAKQQYQYIGDANINIGDPDFTGTIDLFGWSNGEKNNFGANPSANKDDYAGDFVDWGTLFPAEDNWSTLTKDQWNYLLNQRGAGKKQIARVGTVFGVMLFPDEWTMPSGISVTAQYDSYFKVNVYNYTLDQWTELENAGALFMPAAGRRFGGYGNTYRADGITNIGEEYKLQYCTNDLAAYWTSTKNDDGTKVNYLLNLGDKGAKYSTLELGWVEYGHVGHSVRLAKVTPLVVIGDGDNSQVISDNADKTVNVKLDRPFNTSGWGTLCVPFEMSASVIGEAYELGAITKHQTGEGINLNLAKVETIEAGKPYLIKANVPSLDVIKNVTIVNTTGSSYTVTGDGIKITFTGLINGDGQTNGSTEYYVGANDGYLYNATVDKLGLRALFTITDEVGNATKVRARVVVGENPSTGFENITTTDKAVKIIENGQLIIIRDGVKYNAQGIKF